LEFFSTILLYESRTKDEGAGDETKDITMYENEQPNRKTKMENPRKNLRGVILSMGMRDTLDFDRRGEMRMLKRRSRRQRQRRSGQVELKVKVQVILILLLQSSSLVYSSSVVMISFLNNNKVTRRLATIIIIIVIIIDQSHPLCPIYDSPH